MRIRFDATTRRPASSSILVTAPVRLRRVASGLMIEKVRVAAMTGRLLWSDWVGIGAPPSDAGARRQGSALLHPFPVFLGPIAPIDPFPARQQLPREARPFQRIAVEEGEG